MPLLFADDAVLMGSPFYELQQALGGFSAEHEAHLELFPQAEKFKYLEVLFMWERRMERETNGWTVVVKREQSWRVKLSVYQLIYVTALTYGRT